jgi:hypothetical protein
VSNFGQTKILSREEMVQDIDKLFSTIEEVHPDMYAVYPKQRLDKDIERIKSELEPTGDVFYFYKKVAPLVVKLGDGHTNMLYFFQHPDFLNARLFPFSVKISYPDNVIHITQTHNSIPKGAQITSINSKKANDIILEMMEYAPGEKDFFKADMMNLLFTPLLYVLYRDSIFDVEYVFNQERHLTQQVNGFGVKEWEATLSQQGSFEGNVPYTFKTLPEKNVGIIEFNSFSNLSKFETFLDTTFRRLQSENIGNLIIDIRKNGGGNSSLGDALFQYISPVPFAQFGKVIIKVSDVIKQLAQNNNQEVTIPNGIVTHNENAELTNLIENHLRYNGNVFLLISHSTFSSAASFSWTFKYFNMGTVVGEETGGMAVAFGDVIRQSLPNSKFTYGISYKKFYQYGATDENTHGTLPDYSVKSEEALDFTIDLITHKKY